MRKIKNSKSAVAIQIFGAILLIYTAYRSYDLILSTLPDNPYSPILAVIGLAALDGGAIFWLFYFLHGAQADEQEIVAGVMVGANLVGVAITGLGDMILRQTLIEYAIPPTLGTIILYGIPSLVMLNVVAVFVAKLFDPVSRQSKALRKTETALIIASTQKIEDQIEAHAAANAGTLADELLQNASKKRERVVMGDLDLPARAHDNGRHPKA